MPSQFMAIETKLREEVSAFPPLAEARALPCPGISQGRAVPSLAQPASKATGFAEGWRGAAAGPPLQRKPLPRVLCQARGRLLPAEAVRAAS